MLKLILVGAGGFVGAASRYLITILGGRILGTTFPYGTLIVNILGCFLMGMIIRVGYSMWNISDNIKLFLTVGILGGLTTFSTFASETVTFIYDGKIFYGVINIILNVLLSLLGVILGKYVTQII